MESKIKIEMVGEKGSLTLRNGENTVLEKVEVIVNMTEKFLYGFGHWEGQYIFLIGYRVNKSPFYLEMNTTKI